MRKPFRLGLIGSGLIAESEHLPAALASRLVEVVAIVDPVVERASNLAQEYGIQPKIAKKLGEVLGDLDGAIIATPNFTHYELALECIRGGVSMLIEKPLAISTKEGKEIVRTAEERGVTVAVGYYSRFTEGVRLMHTLLTTGYFGRVRSFAYQFGTAGGWAPLSGYNLDRKATGGGVLVVTGTHFLDRLLYWFGYPDEVELEDDSLGGPEANALARFRYLSGPSSFEGTARFSKTVALKGGMVIETDDGKVILHEGNDAQILFKPHAHPAIETVVRGRTGSHPRDPRSPFQRQLEDFVEACENKREPFVSVRQGLESLRLIEDLYSRRKPLCAY